jgi:protein-ribulosamine 3-kinase
MDQSVNNFITTLLAQKSGAPFSSVRLITAGGGSINETFRVQVNSYQHYFLKLNAAKKFPLLFEKEKSGLAFLAKQKIIKTPEVIACETEGEYQLLLMEWIEPTAKNSAFWKKFGEKLALLHCITDEHFGFFEDNYMGALPQLNTMTADWAGFFIQYRLQPQIKIAMENKWLSSRRVRDFEKLCSRLPAIFSPEKPSLLHGDLWHGNFICSAASEPVLIDPAVYFGHRSMDLAMTTLFGGFDKSFYDSYSYHFPLPSHYTEQWKICNLYPLLIHLNLFGQAYLPPIEDVLKKFS